MATVPDVLDPESQRKLKRAADKARRAITERDRLIRSLFDAGAGKVRMREIGRAVDMTHEAIRKILARTPSEEEGDS